MGFDLTACVGAANSVNTAERRAVPQTRHLAMKDWNGSGSAEIHRQVILTVVKLTLQSCSRQKSFARQKPCLLPSVAQVGSYSSTAMSNDMDAAELALLESSLAAMEDPTNDQQTTFELAAAGTDGDLPLNLSSMDVVPDPVQVMPPPPAPGSLASKQARKGPAQKRKSLPSGSRKSTGANKNQASKNPNFKRKAEDDDPNKNEDEHPFKVRASSACLHALRHHLLCSPSAGFECCLLSATHAFMTAWRPSDSSLLRRDSATRYCDREKRCGSTDQRAQHVTNSTAVAILPTFHWCVSWLGD